MNNDYFCYRFHHRFHDCCYLCHSSCSYTCSSPFEPTCIRLWYCYSREWGKEHWSHCDFQKRFLVLVLIVRLVVSGLLAFSSVSIAFVDVAQFLVVLDLGRHRIEYSIFLECRAMHEDLPSSECYEALLR